VADDGSRTALEAALVDLGRGLDLPAGADPAPAVLARLARPEPGHRPAGRRRRPGRLVVAAVAALALLVAVTPAGQAAVSRVVHAFGVVLRLGSPSAPDRPERLPDETVVPGPSSAALDRAREQVGFRPVVPAALGVPDQVLVSDRGRVLSLVYRAGPGRPAPGAGGVSARLDEFDGTLEPFYFKTIQVPADFLDLPDGGVAVWIDQPHDVTYLGRDGKPRTGSAHLAARTLIWQAGAVTLRLEGDFTRDQALGLAVATVKASQTPSPRSTP
jgi:hypothetical protein